MIKFSCPRIEGSTTSFTKEKPDLTFSEVSELIAAKGKVINERREI